MAKKDKKRDLKKKREEEASTEKTSKKASKKGNGSGKKAKEVRGFYRIEIPVSLRTKFKELAHENGQTMTERIEDLIRADVKENR